MLKPLSFLAMVVTITINAVLPVASQAGRLPSANPQALCPANYIFFDQRCRHHSFFNRFLSADAELIGIAGPNEVDGEDTGVVVIEYLPENTLQELYILPDKNLNAQLTLFEYRADYRVANIVAVTQWFNADTGLANIFRAVYGLDVRNTGLFSISQFGLVDWVHRVQTSSGYEEMHDDGTQLLATASQGSSGAYCSEAAAALANAHEAMCTLAASYVSANMAIITGAATFVVLTTDSFGIGAGVAAGAGITVAGGVGSMALSVGSEVCGLAAENLETIVDIGCNELSASAPTAGNLGEFFATDADPDDFYQGSCPVGQVEYIGDATYETCGFDSDAVIEGDEIIVIGENECLTIKLELDGVCLLLDAF